MFHDQGMQYLTKFLMFSINEVFKTTKISKKDLKRYF